MTNTTETIPELSKEEFLASVLAQRVTGCRHLVVGANSPIPASGALLSKSRTLARNSSLLNSGVVSVVLVISGHTCTSPAPRWCRVA